MDYWALGHIHKHEILCEKPYIVYAGNPQGLDCTETGPRGCSLRRSRPLWDDGPAILSIRASSAGKALTLLSTASNRCRNCASLPALLRKKCAAISAKPTFLQSISPAPAACTTSSTIRSDAVLAGQLARRRTGEICFCHGRTPAQPGPAQDEPGGTEQTARLRRRLSERLRQTGKAGS